MIVVDTHVLLWAIARPEKLSRSATAALDEAEAMLVSAATCLEVATLVRRGRLRLDRQPTTWVRQVLSRADVSLVTVDADIAIRAGALPEPFPGDPADRLIYSTAVERGVRLVTRDRGIRDFDPARTVW